MSSPGDRDHLQVSAEAAERGGVVMLAWIAMRQALQAGKPTPTQ
jgi:hypothetical protein